MDFRRKKFGRVSCTMFFNVHLPILNKYNLKSIIQQNQFEIIKHFQSYQHSNISNIYIFFIESPLCIIQKLPTIFFNVYSSILNKSTNSYQLTFTLFENSQYIQLKKHNTNNINLKLSSLSIISTSKYLRHNYEAISLLLKFKLTKYTSLSKLNIYLPEIHPNIDLEPLVAPLSICIHLYEVSPERYGISEMTSHVTQQSCNYIIVQVLI